MFSTLATLVLLSFLLLLGFILLLWSLVAFGTGPKAVSMPWGRPTDLTTANPFVRKQDAASSELAPDYISRGQIRSIKKPVSDVTLAEIKAMTEEKTEKSTKITTYEQMVKRAKHPTVPPRSPTPAPPNKDPKVTQTQVNNDQLRGVYAKRTLIDEPIVDPIISNPGTNSKPPNEIPPFIQVNDIKGLPPLPPVPVRPGVIHSAKDTPITKPNLPTKPVPVPEKPPIEAQPTLFSETVPEKKLWPAPLSPMVPKPAVNAEGKMLFPQPVNTTELLQNAPRRPEDIQAPQTSPIKKSDDAFERFSKDKKDDTLF